jgi:hypothetical protein
MRTHFALDASKAEPGGWRPISDSPEADAIVRASGKMLLLHKLLPKLRAEGRQCLIFSQFKVGAGLSEGGACFGGLSPGCWWFGRLLCHCRQQTNQPVNQQTHKPSNQPTKQPSSQPINQSNKQTLLPRSCWTWSRTTSTPRGTPLSASTAAPSTGTARPPSTGGALVFGREGPRGEGARALFAVPAVVAAAGSGGGRWHTLLCGLGYLAGPFTCLALSPPPPLKKGS